MRVDSNSGALGGGVRAPVLTFASRTDYTAFNRPIQSLQSGIAEDEVGISDRARSMLKGTLTASSTVEAANAEASTSSRSFLSDDTDITAMFSRSQVLQQRATDMLKQANQASLQVLNLFSR
jgi:hypothetical protein